LGELTGAAAKLGLKRTTLIHTMKKLGIERPKRIADDIYQVGATVEAVHCPVANRTLADKSVDFQGGDREKSKMSKSKKLKGAKLWKLSLLPMPSLAGAK
jgi:hypothetical protein